VYAAHVLQGVAAGQRMMRDLGPTGIPVLNIENCSAAGSTAIREAAIALSAEEHDVVVVVGFEKMQPGLLLNVTPEGDQSVEMGLSVLPLRYALMASEHMAKFGSRPDHFAKVSVKNRRHAAHNPYAQYRESLTLEEVLSSTMISDPITKLQCSPVTDGAAAVVMCSGRFLRKISGSRAVRIVGEGLVSDIDLPKSNRHTTDLISRAATTAYERAGLGPDDVDVAEVHDCFSVAEIVSYEALGFCAPGEGGRLIDSGDTEIGGRMPVNTSGGLLSRGHPLGATGVAQVCELAMQLRGEAGRRQVRKPSVGLAYNAGVMSACVTLLMN
jgi:acetyl-CoA acetyltransferase